MYSLIKRLAKKYLKYKEFIVTTFILFLCKNKSINIPMTYSYLIYLAPFRQIINTPDSTHYIHNAHCTMWREL